jgi:hypothetical protein
VFTPEDQQLLDDLSYRKAYSEWASREDQRKAKFARLEPLVEVFTAEKVAPFVTAATTYADQLQETDPEIAEMLSGIATVMGFTGNQLVDRLRLLATSEVEPPAPEKGEEAEEEG